MQPQQPCPRSTRHRRHQQKQRQRHQGMAADARPGPQIGGQGHGEQGQREGRPTHKVLHGQAGRGVRPLGQQHRVAAPQHNARTRQKEPVGPRYRRQAHPRARHTLQPHGPSLPSRMRFALPIARAPVAAGVHSPSIISSHGDGGRPEKGPTGARRVSGRETTQTG